MILSIILLPYLVMGLRGDTTDSQNKQFEEVSDTSSANIVFPDDAPIEVVLNHPQKSLEKSTGGS